MHIQYICLHIFSEAYDSYLLTPSHTQILEMLSHLKIKDIGAMTPYHIRGTIQV